jgi:small subunit ribosomal protein S3
MGHKINPTSFRMNITEQWKSRWFSKNHFAKTLKEDVQIREYLMNSLKKAGIVRIDIERLNDGALTVIIKSTKPGMIIGKGGAGIEDLKKQIKTKVGLKQEIKVNIEEVRDINLQSQVMAQNIADRRTFGRSGYRSYRTSDRWQDAVAHDSCKYRLCSGYRFHYLWNHRCESMDQQRRTL